MEKDFSKLPPLVATSVVRGSEQGQSHGGVFIVDPGSQSVHQVLDWNTADIDWSGRGWDRGLRGIAFHNDEIYIAASDELFVFDQRFRIVRSFRNRYLKHCHEIAIHRGTLYLTSTGFDSILAFSLEQQAVHVGSPCAERRRRMARGALRSQFRCRPDAEQRAAYQLRRLYGRRPEFLRAQD